VVGEELTARRRAIKPDQAAAAPFTWASVAPPLLRHRWLARQPAVDVPDRDSLLAHASAEADEAVERFRALLDDGDDPLAQVVAACELDETDAAVLAVLACCEVDPEALDLAVAGSARRDSRPTGALLADLFGPDGLGAVAPGNPLDRCGLVEVDLSVPLVAAGAAVRRELVWRLLDQRPDDQDLPPDTRAVICPPGMLGSSERVLVHGQDRQRRLQAALATASGLLFYVGPAPDSDAGWRALTRRAGLDGAGLVLELAGQPDGRVRRWIDLCPHLTWALCHRDPIDLAEMTDEPWHDVTAHGAAVSAAEWQVVFPDAPLPPRPPTASQLDVARHLDVTGLTALDAIRRVAGGSLVRHAQRIVPRVGWDELILAPAQERRLHDLVDRYRYRTVVHDEWGLPLFPSPGVVALFSGPSGTGKTTTAEVIAHELGVDMFRVDLSALVSKYIGETEKNLEEIFSAAHAGDYLLLFDEADSLFGTRSKVSDARDRYANMEVSYLLQRLESYDGFVVLTSNFQGNIDQAFLRRIHVTVHFTVPSAEDRTRIWRRCLADAPTDDLDLPFVADKFDLTGGSIRNAALTAAFLAASGHHPIGMVDVLRAISQEMAKLGRRPNDDQFGRWLDDLKD
jgi:hypothetical protein